MSVADHAARKKRGCSDAAVSACCSVAGRLQRRLLTLGRLSGVNDADAREVAHAGQLKSYMFDDTCCHAMQRRALDQQENFPCV